MTDYWLGFAVGSGATLFGCVVGYFLGILKQIRDENEADLSAVEERRGGPTVPWDEVKKMRRWG